MDEKRNPSPEEIGVSRRTLLAVAGTAALAGCNGLPEFGNESEPTIRAHDLPDIESQGDPDPVVPESVPVDIAPEYFDTARDHVTTLLGELPTPLGSEEIPNGYVREQIVDAAADATTGLSDARDAPTGLAALTALQRARAEARYAAAGWAVVEQDLSADSLRSEYEQIVTEAKSERDDHEYVGNDPVRAALVHSRIEGMLDRVIESDEPRRAENRLLHVAEWGDTVGSAGAHLDDARHLDEQFTGSLPMDASMVEETLRGTAETLFADVRTNESDVPPEPTAEDWGIPELVIEELRQRVAYDATRIADTDGPASAVVDANRQLTRFQALEQLQTQVANNEIPDPQSAAAIREIRSTAHDALGTALAESSAPDLTRTAITNAGWRVAHADWELARYEGEIRVSRLDDTIADYIVATAIAQVAPSVASRTVEELKRA